MIDNLKIINFIQDFGCAKIEQLQIIFNDKKNTFKSILNSNMVSKKSNIIVHNTKQIDNQMLIALDILCKYKGRFINFHKGYEPVFITFITKDNIKYKDTKDNIKNEEKKLSQFTLLSRTLTKEAAFIKGLKIALRERGVRVKKKKD